MSQHAAAWRAQVSVNATVVEGRVLARTQHWEHVDHAKVRGWQSAWD